MKLLSISVPLLALLLHPLLAAAAPLPSAALGLTAEESLYLQQHGPIRYCINPNAIPYEQADSRGRHIGVTAELIAQLSQRLAVTFERIPTASLEESLAHPACELLPALTAAENLQPQWQLSKPYLNYPLVFVSRNEPLIIEDYLTLEGRPVGLVAGHTAEALLKAHYPKINWQSLPSIAEGLQQVSDKRLFGLVELLAVAGYHIQNEQRLELKVAQRLPESISFSIAIRTSEPLLQSIIQKGLNSFTAAELKELANSWMAVRFDHQVDYQLLWRVLLGAALVILFIWFRNRDLVSYNRQIAHAHQQLQVAQEQTSTALMQIARLLNHSGEGFLSFDPSLRVKGQYSHECFLLFGGPIDDRAVAELFYPTDAHRATIFARNLAMIFASDDEFQREMLMGLLPVELELPHHAVRIRYEFLTDSMMLVVSDISSERALQAQIAEEQQRLRFVVTVVQNSAEFFDLIAACQQFQNQEAAAILATPAPLARQLSELFRQIHTFKGLTNQLGFIQTPQQLHRLEDQLSRCRHDPDLTLAQLQQILATHPYLPALEADIALIRTTLGQRFFDQREEIRLTLAEQQQLKALAAALTLGPPQNHPDIVRGIALIHELQQVECATLFASYPQHSEALALQMNKLIQPFTLESDGVKVDRNRLAPLARAAIHLFRNAIAHGIELPEERLELGKPEQGLLQCRIERQADMLWITIRDDGRGLDRQRIGAKAVERGLLTAAELAQRTPAEIDALIFTDGFSTNEQVDTLSGRGEGLSALEAECQRLGGWIEIESQLGVGSCFTLKIPL